MDVKEKNRRKKHINSLVADGVREFGFKKTKANWFVRPYDKLAQFMHLHFYKNTNSIRVHLGYRVYNDSFEAIGLNGPWFDGWREDNLNPETNKKYEFGYNIIKHKEDAAANELIVFFREIAMPYFEQVKENDWSGVDSEHKKLMQSEDSPESILLSKNLLKLKT